MSDAERAAAAAAIVGLAAGAAVATHHEHERARDQNRYSNSYRYRDRDYRDLRYENHYRVNSDTICYPRLRECYWKGRYSPKYTHSQFGYR